MASVKEAHIKSFTLFESTISVTIIAILIGIATLIWGNIMDSENPLSYHQAKEKIDDLFYELQQTKSFFDKTYDYEIYRIDQKIDYHRGNKKLYQIEYKVLSGNKEMWSEKHLLVNTNYGREL